MTVRVATWLAASLVVVASLLVAGSTASLEEFGFVVGAVSLAAAAAIAVRRLARGWPARPK